MSGVWQETAEQSGTAGRSQSSAEAGNASAGCGGQTGSGRSCSTLEGGCRRIERCGQLCSTGWRTRARKKAPGGHRRDQESLVRWISAAASSPVIASVKIPHFAPRRNGESSSWLSRHSLQFACCIAAFCIGPFCIGPRTDLSPGSVPADRNRPTGPTGDACRSGQGRVGRLSH